MPRASRTASEPAATIVAGVDRHRIRRLFAEERAQFNARHKKSKRLYGLGKEMFLYGTPSHWMRRWAGGFPIYVRGAHGSRLVDVDGNEYVDFCLGDTGGMCGHGVPEIADAVRRQLQRGASTMLPTEDSLWVGQELTKRFGVPFWNLATSASDANRAAIRLSRMITGRDKVLVFSGCYHGSVEEAHVELRDGHMAMRNDIHPNGIDHGRVSTVVEFNDRESLASALASNEVACVLAEPAMTNCGIVMPDPGYHAFLRDITRSTGTVLIIDETHTISAGAGGYTRAHRLSPDILVLGKAIGGGIPCAVYGISQSIAERIWSVFPPVDPAERQSAHGGFGGTLAGNAVSVAAIRAVLEHVLTVAAFRHSIALATELADETADIIADARLPWHVARVGSRVECMFTPAPPRNGSEAREARAFDLEILQHLYFMNRGVLLTPFHNMALLSPASTSADIERHREVFASFLKSIR